jgi:hypothetical protein
MPSIILIIIIIIIMREFPEVGALKPHFKCGRTLNFAITFYILI